MNHSMSKDSDASYKIYQWTLSIWDLVSDVSSRKLGTRTDCKAFRAAKRRSFGAFGTDPVVKVGGPVLLQQSVCHDFQALCMRLGLQHQVHLGFWGVNNGKKRKVNNLPTLRPEVSIEVKLLSSWKCEHQKPNAGV